MPRSRSWIAPETISEAEALPWSGEQPAGVGAQVDEQRLHPLLAQLGEGGFELLPGGLGEADDAHVADPGPDHVGVGNALDRDLGALDREAERLGLVLAGDRDRDRAPRGAPQQLEDVVVVEGLGERLAVDLHDPVAGADSQAVSGRALERRDDDDRAVADLERDADPRVLAVEVLVHALGALLGQVDGVGVERPQHAVDRALDELRVVRDVDVVVLHQVEHLGEQIELAAQVVGGLEAAGEAEAEQQREGQGRGRRAER